MCRGVNILLLLFLSRADWLTVRVVRMTVYLCVWTSWFTLSDFGVLPLLSLTLLACLAGWPTSTILLSGRAWRNVVPKSTVKAKVLVCRSYSPGQVESLWMKFISPFLEIPSESPRSIQAHSVSFFVSCYSLSLSLPCFCSSSLKLFAQTHNIQMYVYTCAVEICMKACVCMCSNKHTHSYTLPSQILYAEAVGTCERETEIVYMWLELCFLYLFRIQRESSRTVVK